jgi:hypothetical protein
MKIWRPMTILRRLPGSIRDATVFSLLLILAVLLPGFAKNAKPTSDEIVANHLASLGTPEARAAVISRTAQGKVTFSESIQHSLYLEGTAMLMSQDDKHRCTFQFATPHYPGEQFVFDGKKIMVAMVDQTSRSRLGNFLFLQEEILRDGLWGGTLSTAWPLLKLKESGATVKYEGTKKIGGRQLLQMSYVPKNRSQNGELLIKLYFDPENYRHVLTTYQLTMLHGSTTLSDPDQTTVTVEEQFSDFREVDGVTLPTRWNIRYRVEPQTVAQEYQWDVSLSSIKHNTL